MYRFSISLLLLALVAQSVSAQTHSGAFAVRVFGGTDTEAPTTSVLSGSAIATSQVDMTWTAAIDNFSVSGYVLFRDGLPIATTSQTTYSDVGLVASTTYSYYIKAFDPSFNYSSSSNVLTVVTPSNPVVPPSEDGQSSQGTATRVVLNNFDIEAKERSAVFSIATARPARFEVRWGRTASYELGYTVNDVYVSSYKTTLSDLEPGTTYQYEVIGYTPLGKPTVLERGTFATVSLADSFPPTNVGSFSATKDGDTVRLAWAVPQGGDIASVRIVRSHLRFPTHPQDGVVVYQGLGTTVADEDVLAQYSPVYYTAFSIDTSGNVSSGAVARVYALAPGGVVSDDAATPPIPSGTDGSVKDDTVASTSASVAPGTRMPQLEEIFLQQRDTKQSLSVQQLTLDSEGVFLLTIPKSAISDNLKTIIASLTDPTDSRKTYSFMLRINKDQTAYEAVLPPTRREGMSRLIIDIYDYESLIVANYQKTIVFKKGMEAEVIPVFPDKIITTITRYGWMVAAPLLLSLVLFLMYRKRRNVLEDNL